MTFTVRINSQDQIKDVSYSRCYFIELSVFIEKASKQTLSNFLETLCEIDYNGSKKSIKSNT